MTNRQIMFSIFRLLHLMYSPIQLLSSKLIPVKLSVNVWCGKYIETKLGLLSSKLMYSPLRLLFF